MILSLKEEPIGNVYKKLIEYACNNNNVLMFEVITYNVGKESQQKDFKTIGKLLNKKDKEIIKNYNNEKFLNTTYLKLEKEENVPWEQQIKEIYKILAQEDSLQDFEKIKKNIIKENIKTIIYNEAREKFFEEEFEQIKKILQENLIRIEYQKKETKNMNTCDKYFYKISDTVEKMLLQQQGLYNMKSINYFENMQFFNSNNCWLKTISHENFCNIYPKDEREINYLRDIGLKFDVVEE